MKRRTNKYHNKKVTIDGIRFASTSEGNRYLELKAEKEAGRIRDFSRQPRYLLQESFRKNGELFRAIHYVADFLIINLDGSQTIEDVKGWLGYTTPEFKLKRKLFEYRYPDLTLTITQMKRKGKPPRSKVRTPDNPGRKKKRQVRKGARPDSPLTVPPDHRLS